MKREEITNSRAYQVSKAALKYYNEHQDKDIDLTDAFEEGAKWADKTIIEKARDWLQCIDFEVEYFTTDSDGYTFFDADKFIENFCKAMEE